jgi:cysteinyl-tRNA synthetase
LFVKPLKTDDKASDAITPKLVELFIRLRADAKKEKNFSLADKIRDELAGLGVTLEDRPGGTDWRLQ